MNKIKDITIGCDPEVFLEDVKTGKIISAVGLIGGTKYQPKPISNEGHAIQEDNVLMEFCIPPSKTVEEFTKHINFVKEYLDVITIPLGGKPNYSASAILDKEQLQTPQAQEFGCEPDFNVYLQCPNTPPDPEGLMRSAGGHIHIGFNNKNMSAEENETLVEDLVKAMDICAGLESILLDKDDRRKELYGKAGCFRFKSYGLEYRTLSNFWIANDELINWAWNATIKAINMVNSGEIKKLTEKYSKKVIEAINTNNKILANELLEEIFKKETVLV